MSDIALLKNINVLSGLSDREIGDVARRASPVRLEKGGRLFYRHDESSGVYFVVEGSIQIIIDNDANREIIVYTVKAGDIVGEMSLFENRERSATAVALEDSRLFKVSGGVFLELMHIYPAIGVNLSRVLVERLLAANEMIERLGAMDGEQRVAHFLRALAVREGARDGDFYRLDGKPTYRQVSNRLGVSEKTVYRAMRAMAETGQLKTRGRKLYLSRSLVER
ncbi:MAG: Crp/Fnr family transcriptional regulator [Candidatus Nitrospinota bacterium M3_3B_026]